MTEGNELELASKWFEKEWKKIFKRDQNRERDKSLKTLKEMGSSSEPGTPLLKEIIEESHADLDREYRKRRAEEKQPKETSK